MSAIRNSYGSFSRYSADLTLFLLVAKHGQLSGAAIDAGISQPRVSQRIRALESSLGYTLFLRERRGVTLTTDGQRLKEALQDPLAAAIDAFDRFRNASRRDRVVILSDIAFANFLLLPEFGSLNEAFKDLSISLLTVQVPEPGNYPDADMVVRMEPAHETATQETLLFPERVSAVCSPDFKARHGDMRAASDLQGKTLIDLVSKGPAPWYTWSEWLSEQGCAHRPSQDTISFNSYDHIISAARAGLGVALGWEGLVHPGTTGSGLVRAIPAQRRSGRGYYLRIMPTRVNARTVAVFNWLSHRFTIDDMQ